MNVENVEDDVWNISCWKTDISNKIQYVKQFLSCASFPNCCRQVLHIIGKLYESSSPENLQSPALFVSAFISELIDSYLFHNTGSRLSSLQELRLLEVMCQYFQSQKSEFVRWCAFDLLFSFSNQEQKESKFNSRIDLLTKLVSMAIALKNGNVLDCMALWIQKHRQASVVAVQVTMAIINEYTSIVPLSLPFLEKVSSMSPQLACQMLVVLTSEYAIIPTNTQQETNIESSRNNCPSLLPLKVAVKWISEDPSVCLIKPNRTLITLPSLHNQPTLSQGAVPLPLCPVHGLVHWTVLQPLVRCSVEESKAYSELHLGVLQALVMSGQTKRNPKDEMELEPGEVMDESDMLRHLLNSDDLKSLTLTMMTMIDSLKKDDDNFDSSQKLSDINLSIDRLAQVIQVAVATGCLSSSKGELLSICKSVTYNKLLDTVICNLDSL